MKNTVVYFEIQATEPEKLIEFYAQVFDWKFSKEENLPIVYYRIETAGMMGGLLQRPAAIPPTHCGTNAFTCSMEVENFDKIAALILKKGGQVALPKFAIPGRCYQGYFIDTDNNVFGIFEVDSQAH
ncbi:VOC family protein [Sphingobacterium sp. SG20118]|uniref:VOC family protein n=1 Tax=Sphingobacterium TaxID=28453 RepID=UPI0004F61FB9|nr:MULTISPECIES: VOC family protein [Sphingobacterium]AIM36313.1 lactoylglutathione lyase [Sphingobacterium sp. ML3W]MDH5827556.1 VOC family protein [Sphingobacterium faecium]